MTLLELVVALMVVGLITLTLTETLRFGISATTVIEARTDKISELRNLHHFLRGQIESARTAYWHAGGKRVLAFDGSSDVLAFGSRTVRGPQAGGLFRLRLGVTGQSLVLSSRPHAGTASGFDFSDGARNVPLSRGVARLRIAYLGIKSGARNARWHVDWRGQSALPELVQLDLEFKDGRVSPKLKIALSLGPQPR